MINEKHQEANDKQSEPTYKIELISWSVGVLLVTQNQSKILNIVCCKLVENWKCKIEVIKSKGSLIVVSRKWIKFSCFVCWLVKINLKIWPSAYANHIQLSVTYKAHRDLILTSTLEILVKAKWITI